MDPFPRDSSPLPLPLSSSFAVSLHTVTTPCWGRWGSSVQEGHSRRVGCRDHGPVAFFFPLFFFFLSIRSAAQISIGGMKERKTKEADKKTRGRWWMGGGGGGGTRRGTYTWSWWMGNRSRGGRSLSRD